MLVFSYQSYDWYPRFYRFRAPGSLQFSLEHSLANTYPLDSDLSCGERHPTFDQPRPQYSSQIVETQTVSLELSPKFLTLTLHTFVLTQMCPSPSLILSHAYFEALRRLQYPNQHWGRGSAHKCFNIFDEYCRF